MEIAAVAFGLPAWCAFNLLLHSNEKGLLAPFPSAATDLKLMAWSLILTTGIPTILMFACSPSTGSALFSQQMWILIRLFHPLFLAIGHHLLRSVSQASCRQSSGRKRSCEADYAEVKENFYFFAFWTAAGPHLITVSAAALAHLAPYLLPAEIAKSLTIGALWPVQSIWRSFFSKVEPIQHGVSVFMTANEAISTITIMLWAWHKNTSIIPQERRNFQNSLRTSAAKAILSLLVYGSGGTAVVLIRNRDLMLRKVR